MVNSLHPLLAEIIKNDKRLADSDVAYRSDCRSIWLDQKMADRFSSELPIQKAITELAAKEGFMPIQVGVSEGNLLRMLIQSIGGRVGVEFGTLAGYSASWICRAIEKQTNAKLHTLELNPKSANFARNHLKQWAAILEFHVGSALDTIRGPLQDLKSIDFAFIDADKVNYVNYFDWSWERLRPGGIILIDNFYCWGGIYFADQEAYPEHYSKSIDKLNAFSESQWLGFRQMWNRLEEVSHHAQVSILPTSEGMAYVQKPML